MECPNCGKIADDNSVFCENCGTLLNQQMIQNNKTPVNNSLKNGKLQFIMIMAILSIIISIVAFFGTIFHVMRINGDRIMLYPLLSLMLSFYCSFKLIENDDAYILAAFVLIIPTLFFIVAAII